MTQDTLWAPVAGKYGRTRDGRKVGPMIRHPNSDFPWIAQNPEKLLGNWTRNGRSYNGDITYDLISEWVDDPASAQPIDFSKVKPGDTLLVKIKFRDAGKTSFWGQYLGDDHPNQIGAGSRFALSDAVQHIPAVRPIEVGCMVSCGTESRGCVRAIDAGEAWVRWESGREQGRSYGYKLADLTRIDGEPE